MILSFFLFFYSCIAGSKKTKKDVERLKSPTQKLTFSPKEKSEEQSRKTATSLILFEEVDVIFEEDSGFLAAIKTFMTTTKRPVILTTSGEMTTKVKDDILLCQVFNLCVCVCVNALMIVSILPVTTFSWIHVNVYYETLKL